MWSNPDGKCVPTKAEHSTNFYRYKPNDIPGNVNHDPAKRDPMFETGSFLYEFFYVVIPSIAGFLMFLFFFCTAIYLAFTIMRLFYLDTLKPYKRKTLKALGKYRRSHIRKRHDSKQRDSTSNPRESRRISAGLVDEIQLPSRKSIDKSEPLIDLIHPPGQKLSFTSPPQPTHPQPTRGVEKEVKFPITNPENEKGPLRKSQATGPDEPMVKKKVDGPELKEFPPNKPSLYIEGEKPPYPSRIPVHKNNSKWVWNPSWYKKQVQDEKGAANVVDKISKNFMVDTSDKPASPVPLAHRPTQTINLTPPPPPVADNVQTGIIPDIETSSAKVPSSHSKPKTAIPKTPQKKPYTQQFMILRGAPRKNSVALEEMRKKRKSSLQVENDTAAKSETHEPPKNASAK